jgi:rod shape-determining protein MreC
VRNLIYFIKIYYSFFVFLILELICLLIVFKNNSYQQSSYINSARSISSSFYTKKESIVSFLTLNAVNDSLVKENARLKQALGIPVTANPFKDTSYTITRTLDSNAKQTVHYKYIAAKVINNSTDQKINYITLNVGSRQGIKPKMAVITDKGVVGKISHVSENYSVAVSILSDRFNVNCVVPDGSIGNIKWDNKDPNMVLLKGIPLSANLKLKDSIMTSGYSIFPEKIMIGKVAKFVNGDYQVWLSTNFNNLHYVYVVQDFTNIERTILEDSVQAETDIQ